MIEVNLHPGASKRPARRSARLPFKLPKFGGGFSMPTLDRMTLFVVAAWIVGPLAVAWLFLGTAHRKEELTVRIEEAVRDSARYAELIKQHQELIARRDTIAQKLQMIQDIDAGRYIWPHILDEVSQALPEYTWLARVQHTEGGDPLHPHFQVVGRTGNMFALTRFLKDLEASPFISGVRLNNTELVKDGENRVVHEFIIQAAYEDPPSELIETVPIFVVEEEEGI